MSVNLCYVAAKGKRAMKALQWLRGKDTDISQELHEIENAHNEAEKNATGSTFELFNKSNLRPLLISLGLMFFQQMSGINAVVFYTVMIFKVRNFVLNFSKCAEFNRNSSNNAKKRNLLPKELSQCYSLTWCYIKYTN
jgi:hypothetical protein